MKTRTQNTNQNMINLNINNPNLPTAPHIVAKLAEATNNPHAHNYSASRNIPKLRKTQTTYYTRHFNVDLDPKNKIIITLKSKKKLTNLTQTITSPNNTILIPNPNYPIHPYNFIITTSAKPPPTSHSTNPNKTYEPPPSWTPSNQTTTPTPTPAPIISTPTPTPAPTPIVTTSAKPPPPSHSTNPNKTYKPPPN